MSSWQGKTRGNKFGYWFFMDFYGHIDNECVQKAIQKHKDEVTWLGSYVSDSLKVESK